jgi:cystinosin
MTRNTALPKMAASLLYHISGLFGWIYTLCWSLSFYPQPILNFRRQSTSGTAIDFPFVNVLGFLAYFVSNSAFLYSPRIREEYALRHHGLTPTVQTNDVAFALHACLMSSICLSQFVPGLWGFDKRGKGGAGSRISKGILGIFCGSIIGVGVVAIIVGARHDENPATGWAWIDVVSPSSPTAEVSY